MDFSTAYTEFAVLNVHSYKVRNINFIEFLPLNECISEG